MRAAIRVSWRCHSKSNAGDGCGHQSRLLGPEAGQAVAARQKGSLITMAAKDQLLNGAVSVLGPVHREGHMFILAGAVATVVAFFLSGTLALVLALATGFVTYFFRDPPRVTPTREGLVIAAADGVVASIDEVQPPMEIGLGAGERHRIVVHLSMLDVHVNRSPVAGRVARSIYVPGAFVSISGDKDGDDNERRILVIETQAKDEIAVVQIAGMIARRIVTFAYEGDAIAAGERFGLIRFGSRVDVYLPVGKTPLVAVGQRTVAGETILADLRSSEGARETRRS